MLMYTKGFKLLALKLRRKIDVLCHARLQSRTDPASRYDSPPCETLKHEFCAVQSTTLPRYQPIYQPIPITGLPYLGSPPLNRTLAALCS
ncbi:hypothetical protein PoMZ_03792, partial [Pyricularia oryzae]